MLRTLKEDDGGRAALKGGGRDMMTFEMGRRMQNNMKRNDYPTQCTILDVTFCRISVAHTTDALIMARPPVRGFDSSVVSPLSRKARHVSVDRGITLFQQPFILL